MGQLLLIIFLFLGGFANIASAKHKEYTVFFSTGHDYLNLTGVERTDTSTVLKMRCTGLPGDRFKIRRKLYLDDENSIRYPLQTAIGVKVGEYSTWPLSGVVDFELHFPPLPKHCRIFDLRTAGEVYSSFAFWGIHPKEMNLKKITEFEDNAMVVDSNIMSGAPTVVMGKILDYDAKTAPGTIRSVYSPLTREAGNRSQSVSLAEDGCFEFLQPYVECPSWSYLEYDDRKIPVFLVPGDTLIVNMKGLFTVDEHIEYESKTGKDIMRNLLQADPKFMKWEHYRMRGQRMRPSELAADIQASLASMKSFCGYMKWKHKLSSLEVHLLYLSMVSNLNEISQSIMSADLQLLHPDSKTQKLNSEEYYRYATSPEICEAFKFLREYDLNDYSHFMIPFQEFVRSLTLVPTIFSSANRSGYENRIEILETYIGQPFNEYIRTAILGGQSTYR